MIKDEFIMQIKDYGKINLKLKDLLEKRNITRNYLARAINTRFEVIDKWYDNNVEKMDFDILARICFVLNCKVEDIIEYRETEQVNKNIDKTEAQRYSNGASTKGDSNMQMEQEDPQTIEELFEDYKGESFKAEIQEFEPIGNELW